MKKIQFKLKNLLDPIVINCTAKIVSIKNKDAICTREGGLCRKGSRNCCNYLTKKGIISCYKANINYYGFNTVNELKVKDFIGYPINTNNFKPGSFKDIIKLQSYWIIDNNAIYTKFKRRKRKIFNNFSIDKSFLILCGWYVSEGCCSSKNTSLDGTVSNRLIRFTLNENEVQYSNDIIKSIKKIGLHYKLYNKGDHAIDVSTSSVVLSKFLGDNFGCNAKSKRIPEWVKNLDLNSLKYFLKGIVQGDGCRYKNHMVYASASKELIKDLFDVLLKFGCIPFASSYLNRGIINIRNGTIHKLIYGEKKHPMYRIDCNIYQCRDLFKFFNYTVFGKEIKGFKYIIDKNYIYFSIKSKTEL